MTAHVSENSPAKASVRKEITKAVKTYAQAMNSNINFSGLCGEKGTQEKELRKAMPEVNFHMVGFEKDPNRRKKIQESGIINEVVKGNINNFPLLKIPENKLKTFNPLLDEQDGFDIVYYDYCGTVLCGMKGREDRLWQPLEEIIAAQEVINPDYSCMAFFTFSLKTQHMSPQKIFKTWLGEIACYGIVKPKIIKEIKSFWEESNKDCLALANATALLFHRLPNVKVIMNRVYGGGDGIKYQGTPMQTIGILITNNPKSFDFQYRTWYNILCYEIERTNPNRKETLMKQRQKIKQAEQTGSEARIKKAFSIAVRTLSDEGYSNKEIADSLNCSIHRVGSVMAWKKNRSSWMA